MLHPGGRGREWEGEKEAEERKRKEMGVWKHGTNHRMSPISPFNQASWQFITSCPWITVSLQRWNAFKGDAATEIRRLKGFIEAQEQVFVCSRGCVRFVPSELYSHDKCSNRDLREKRKEHLEITHSMTADGQTFRNCDVSRRSVRGARTAMKDSLNPRCRVR